MTLFSGIGLAAMVVTEHTLEKEQEKITGKTEQAVSRGIGRGIGPAGVWEWKNAL